MADSQPDGGGPRTWFYLLMTGAVAAFSWLTNWTEERETLRRDVYASKEDCVKDWGEERNCEEAIASPQGFFGGGARYYGPSYRSGDYGSSPNSKPEGTVDSARPGSHAVGTAHVSRGGFGGSGAAHGASGS